MFNLPGCRAPYYRKLRTGLGPFSWPRITVPAALIDTAHVFSLLGAKVPDIERDGMDAAFAAARRAFSSWSKLTWEARRSILEKAFISCLSGRRRFQQVITSEGRPALKRLAPDCPQFYGEGPAFCG